MANARSGKRGNGEGTITKRPDGRWEARVTLDNGKRKSLYAKTRQEAARLLTEATRDRDRGRPVVPEHQTVGQYLVSWLEMVRPTIHPSAWKRYRELLTLHVLPTYGKLPPGEAHHPAHPGALRCQAGSGSLIDDGAPPGHRAARCTQSS